MNAQEEDYTLKSTCTILKLEYLSTGLHIILRQYKDTVRCRITYRKESISTFVAQEMIYHLTAKRTRIYFHRNFLILYYLTYC